MCNLGTRTPHVVFLLKLRPVLLPLGNLIHYMYVAGPITRRGTYKLAGRVGFEPTYN